jgi:coenzyme F420 hydrogenase subunit beta
MLKTDISKVVENHLCNSCGACATICNSNAINFKITNVGRLHPVIDYNVCTKCGMCYRICPSLDSDDIIYERLSRLSEPFYGDVICCYAGKSKNENVYKNSQSGGLLTQFLIYLFSEKLITHAVVVRMNHGNPPRPECYFATSTKDLLSSQKSIYNPVNILTLLKDIKKIEGSFALVGLPCHIEGYEILYKYNDENFNKIKYKIGLICDGLLSFSSVDYFAKRIKINEDFKIIYRNKSYPNYVGADVTIQTANKKEFHIDKTERLFLKKFLTPPRCNLCFNKMNIFADVVFGDAWGIDGVDLNKGESIAICRTDLGRNLFKGMIEKGMAVIKSIDYSEILKGQRIDKHILRTISFFKAYKKITDISPRYLEILEKGSKLEDSHIRNAEKYIRRFLFYEKIKREKFINMLIWKIRKRKIFSFVKNFFKKGFILL